MIATDPSLRAVGSYQEALKPRPYSPVIGELFERMPGADPVRLIQLPRLLVAPLAPMTPLAPPAGRQGVRRSRPNQPGQLGLAGGPNRAGGPIGLDATSVGARHRHPPGPGGGRGHRGRGHRPGLARRRHPAQLYRVASFRAHGFAIWDSQWFGGHWTLSYSVLYPGRWRRWSVWRR